MKGVILGDICGSVYEMSGMQKKEFPFFSKDSTFTDDTVLTVAVMEALNNLYLCKLDQKELALMTSNCFKRYTWSYPWCGYGRNYIHWVYFENSIPYNSCGNGAAMRISPVGLYSQTEEEVKVLSRIITEITHNHPEGIRGAEATAMAIYLAKHGASKEAIFERMCEYYHSFRLMQSLEEMRDHIQNGEEGKILCQYSVPQAISCFLLSTDYEDCVRNCISLGGDSDTIAAIAGGIAEAYYGGVPNAYWQKAEKIIPNSFRCVCNLFYDICKQKEDLCEH